ncbi:MAG TPA: tetratricopeptide repeat protein [Rhodocyclaceae bacterium]|nr:tetratricopeptide repeat protein [Rhodocyclaceae bacterium]HNA04125.1 tetratricopeptide repeat protein [Rhodocyclaceae bacterium]
MTQFPAGGCDERELMAPAEFERLADLLARGKYATLEQEAARLAVRFPEDGRTWQLLGVSHLARDQDQAALGYLERASRAMPENAAIWDNLGLVRYRLREFAPADDCFRRATSIQPDLLSAWVNWSANSRSAGDAAGAERQARQALQLQGSSAAAWLNFGNALFDQARLEEAERAFVNALQLQPSLLDARIGYGMVIDARGRQDDAVRCFESVLAMAPGDWRALSSLGKIHSAMGNSSMASACYRQATQSSGVADEVFSGLLFLRLYEEGADPANVFADHCAFGERLEAPFRAVLPNHANARDPDKTIKLGFVSGDFRSHPVAHFFEPFLAALDRARFEACLYSSHPVEDDVSRRLRGCADSWANVSALPDTEFARRIRRDGIDVLVDLAGHSSYNRLRVFAQRPAPVQVSWLGYPATTGLRSIDYRPIFAAADPDRTLQQQFSERLVHVHCAPGFRHPTYLPDVGVLPALKRGGVTFANLNRSDKLGDAVVRTWCRILDGVPGARLLLGGVPNPEVARSLVERFAMSGIPEGRLKVEMRVSMDAYLALHRDADILLDPFPFSGLTTSEHALSMGLPVLTLAGRSLASRQGLVVMGSLGLDEWVAWSEDAYVRKAVEFASDRDRLAALRSDLRQCLMSVSDSAIEAACMQSAFREMWRRWCCGLPAVGFEVCRDGAVLVASDRCGST